MRLVGCLLDCREGAGQDRMEEGIGALLEGGQQGDFAQSRGCRDLLGRDGDAMMGVYRRRIGDDVEVLPLVDEEI